jgi:uncharacterized protein YhdP
MQSRDLTTEVLGGVAKVAVSAQDGGVRIAAGGHADLAAVAKEFDLPMRDRISGITDWQLVAQSRGASSSWSIESSLAGADLAFPAPIGKVASEGAPLRIERRESTGRGVEEPLTIDYRGSLRVVAHRDLTKGAGTVDRALLLLGKSMARGGTADRPGVWVRGDIADFDVDEWLALRAKESSRRVRWRCSCSSLSASAATRRRSRRTSAPAGSSASGHGRTGSSSPSARRWSARSSRATRGTA